MESQFGNDKCADITNYVDGGSVNKKFPLQKEVTKLAGEQQVH